MAIRTNTVVISVLLLALTAPPLMADEGAPWDQEEVSPADAVALQAAAHRVTGLAEEGTEANEPEAVGQLWDLAVSMGVDEATADMIAAAQAESIKKATEMKPRRRRGGGVFRWLFTRTPLKIVTKVTDPLYKLAGPRGRRIIRGMAPEIQDVALSALFAGASIKTALRALVRSRLKQVKRVVVEDTIDRLIARLQTRSTSGNTTQSTVSDSAYVFELTEKDFLPPADPSFGLGSFLWDEVSGDLGEDPFCQTLQLQIDAIEMRVIFDPVGGTILASFDGSGQEIYREPAGNGVERGNDAIGDFTGELAAGRVGTTPEGWHRYEGDGELAAEISVTMYCTFWSNGELRVNDFTETGSRTADARVEILVIPESENSYNFSFSINSALSWTDDTFSSEPSVFFGGRTVPVDLAG